MKTLQATIGWGMSLIFHFLVVLILLQLWIPSQDVGGMNLVFSVSDPVEEDLSVSPVVNLPQEDFLDRKDNNEDDGESEQGEADDTILAAATFDESANGLAGDGGGSLADGNSFGDGGDGKGGAGAYHDRIYYLIDSRFYSKTASYHLYEKACERMNRTPSKNDFLKRQEELIEANLTDQQFIIDHFDKLVQRTANRYDTVTFNLNYLASRHQGPTDLRPGEWSPYRRIDFFGSEFWFSPHGDAYESVVQKLLHKYAANKGEARNPDDLHPTRPMMDCRGGPESIIPTRFCILTSGEVCKFHILKRGREKYLAYDWADKFQEEALGHGIKVDVVYLAAPRSMKGLYEFASKRLRELSEVTGGDFRVIGYQGS